MSQVQSHLLRFVHLLGHFALLVLFTDDGNLLGVLLENVRRLGGAFLYQDSSCLAVKRVTYGNLGVSA